MKIILAFLFVLSTTAFSNPVSLILKDGAALKACGESFLFKRVTPPKDLPEVKKVQPCAKKWGVAGELLPVSLVNIGSSKPCMIKFEDLSKPPIYEGCGDGIKASIFDEDWVSLEYMGSQASMPIFRDCRHRETTIPLVDNSAKTVMITATVVQDCDISWLLFDKKSLTIIIERNCHATYRGWANAMLTPGRTGALEVSPSSFKGECKIGEANYGVFSGMPVDSGNRFWRN